MTVAQCVTNITVPSQSSISYWNLNAFSDTRGKYFAIRSVGELFEHTKSSTIIDFIKEIFITLYNLRYHRSIVAIQGLLLLFHFYNIVPIIIVNRSCFCYQPYLLS